jgi:hypothetical protein
MDKHSVRVCRNRARRPVDDGHRVFVMSKEIPKQLFASMSASHSTSETETEESEARIRLSPRHSLTPSSSTALDVSHGDSRKTKKNHFCVLSSVFCCAFVLSTTCPDYSPDPKLSHSNGPQRNLEQHTRKSSLGEYRGYRGLLF